MKVKITETRSAVVELKPENYDPEMRTPKAMIECEKSMADELPEYMDMLEADSDFTFEFLDGEDDEAQAMNDLRPDDGEERNQ